MKIAIIGATGVFGSRLARLLARDGHALILVARRGAVPLAQDLSARSLALDVAHDLTPLFAHNPDLVIDAAGPFQAYSGYALARAAIAHGVNYADLSDDAEFTAGIAALDAEAKAAGVYALSGVSSVPALSGAVVTEIAQGMERIDTIDSAILPGNRAPRGRSVMAAVLAQVGHPMRLWRGGAWENVRGWSDPAIYELPGGLKRRAWLIGAPDLALFPGHFGARTVVFRAGLELGVMNWSLAALSWLRARIQVPVSLAHWLALRVEPLGTDRGGMVVSVTGKQGGYWMRRTWRLLVQAGEGPFIPAVPARALVAQGGAAPGARAAVDDIPLCAHISAMRDLCATFERDEEHCAPLFPQLLGASFETLPPPVRDSHDVGTVLRLEGRATVTRGAGLWPRLIAWLFGFPPAARDVPVVVIKTRSGPSERWDRRFGAHVFRSWLRPEAGRMTERFGPITFTLGLRVHDNALEFPVTGARIGPVPLPRALLPVSDARETGADGTFRFDVTLRAPLTGGFIVRYQGQLDTTGARTDFPLPG